MNQIKEYKNDFHISNYIQVLFTLICFFEIFAEYPVYKVCIEKNVVAVIFFN